MLLSLVSLPPQEARAKLLAVIADGSALRKLAEFVEAQGGQFLPAPFPILTIFRARAKESASVFINAPLPVLTSSTMASAPAASLALGAQMLLLGKKADTEEEARAKLLAVIADGSAAASFLLIMELAISGILSTVAVTSLSA